MASTTSVLLMLVALIGVGAGRSLAADQSQRLDEAREKAAEATARYDAALADLGRIDVEIASLEAEVDRISAEMDDLRGEVRAIAVQRFTSNESGGILLETDLNRFVRAEVMAEVVVARDADAIERYEALDMDLAEAKAAAAEARDRQEAVVADLEQAEAEIYRNLEILEEEERQRIEEERRRLEEEARRRAEEERLRQAATSTTASPVTTEVEPPGSSTTTSTAPAPPDPIDPPVGSGGFLCPVQGPVFFTDTYGAPRPGGRWHQGVDMMATRGTPVVASVSGTVRHHNSSLGGLSYYLEGSDGREYFGTHLDSYAASGQVSAGTVVGYVGSTGNASDSAPHLHFEVKVNGRNVNPTPIVDAAC